MAFLAAAFSGISAALPAIQAIGAVASFVGQISAAEQQASAQRLQARQAELQGRQNALNYNRQAVQIFERQQRLAGTIRARAAAAGVDPLTGSPLTMGQINAMNAGREMAIAQENAELSLYGGLAQSQSLRAAASTTMTQGITGGLMNLGLAAAGMAKTATPSAKVIEAPVETAIPRVISAPTAAPVFNLAPTAPTIPYFPSGIGSPATSYPVMGR